MSRVWDEATDIRGGDLLVLLALADFADDEGRCWPSVATIAKKARLTERQAYRSLKALEASGHLHRNSSPGKRASYVLIPTPDKLSGDPGQDVTPDNLSPLTHGQVTPEQMSGLPLTSDPLPPTPPNKEEPSLEPSGEPSLLLDSTSSESNGQLVLADPSQSTPAPPRRINGHEFDRFWKVYPRKVGKAGARKAFKQACQRADLEEIIDGASQLRRLHESGRKSMQYLPHPSTWLNRDGWTDDPEHVAPSEESTTDNRVRGFLDIANSYLQGEATHAEVGNGSPARHDQRL